MDHERPCRSHKKMATIGNEKKWVKGRWMANVFIAWLFLHCSLFRLGDLCAFQVPDGRETISLRDVVKDEVFFFFFSSLHGVAKCPDGDESVM